MARYVYKCDCSDSKYEVVHKMTEDPLIVCEKCGGVMYRVPQNFQVRWAEGLSPYKLGQGDPKLMSYLSDVNVEQRREQYAEDNDK